MTTTATRHARREEGVCVDCGGIPIDTYCAACREMRAESQAKLKARWIREGKCCRCGGKKDEGFKTCTKCRKYWRRHKSGDVAA